MSHGYNNQFNVLYIFLLVSRNIVVVTGDLITAKTSPTSTSSVTSSVYESESHSPFWMSQNIFDLVDNNQTLTKGGEDLRS